MDWQKHFAERSKESSTFGGGTMQSDDIDAINRYIVEIKPKTKEASKLRDEWIRWHDQLSWWDINMDSTTYDHARNRRNAFNIANSISAAEREFVRQVQQTGLSSEEIQGGTKRVLSSGMYETPEQPLIPTSFKVGVAVTLITAGLGYAAYKVYSPTSLLGFIRG